MDAQNTVQLWCIWLHDKASKGEGKNEQRKLVGRMMSSAEGGVLREQQASSTQPRTMELRERGFLEKVHPPMMLTVSVEDIAACLEERNKELPDIAKKVPRAMRLEGVGKGLRLKITEGGKEGQSKQKTWSGCET